MCVCVSVYEGAVCVRHTLKCSPSLTHSYTHTHTHTHTGIYLLEVNLSCNFFRGAFDKEKYFTFCSDYIQALQKLKEEKEGKKDQ
jgi:hypothetical protein